MVLNLFALLACAAAWIAVLWLAIMPDFTKWTHPGIISLHAFPPLAIWLIWAVIRRRNREKESKEALAREQQAQAEREAVREAARKKHDEAMRQRRFSCDCRAVTIAGIALNSELPLLNVATENIEVQSRPVEEALAAAANSVLDRLAPAIRDALASLYNTCGTAAAFPIFILPPSDVSGEETQAVVRSAYDDIIEKSGLRNALGTSSPPILFLPSTDSAADSAIALFDSTSDLPGAVMLAFDSPLSRVSARAPDGDIDPDLQKRERQAGKPSEGVIALLLTNPDLTSMLKAIDSIDNQAADHDSMTPYWQKSLQAEGYLAFLSRASRELRSELAQLPVLGQIRRAAFRAAPVRPAGMLEMTRLMQESLEQAQINAGIIELPFAHDGAMATEPVRETAAEQQAATAPTPGICRRLVHNAGGVDYAGKRLAALGSAMHYFNIDLNPVDIEMSTNIATQVGDLGRAAGIGQLALGVAHAADTGSPALCAEFLDHGGFAFAFITPIAAES